MPRIMKRGFTLIEVLVTLVILMFGLLGIAGLMAKGQRASFEAFQRQQALALANDMAERMWANRSQSTVYADGAPIATPLGYGNGNQYNNLLNNTIMDCGASNCSPQNLAAYDLGQWDGLLLGYSETQTASGNRVGGLVDARGCIVEIANTLAACPPTPAPPATFYTRTNRISVAWQGQEDTGAPVASPSNCGTTLYGATDGRRRLVTLDVMLQVQCN